jgi:hypothetical protein
VPHLVFAEAEVVEQEIARSIAQHLVQGRPRRRRLERRIEQLLDPGGIQVLVRAVPGIAQGPDAALGRVRPRRLAPAHNDVARDRAARGWGALAREPRLPFPGGRRGDLDDPEIRRPAVALARFRRDASIGRDERKLALERPLRGEDDAQRRAVPRREWRGQDRELSRVFAAAGWSLGPRVHDGEKEEEQCAGDRQQSWSSSKPAGQKQLSPLTNPDQTIAEIVG